MGVWGGGSSIFSGDGQWGKRGIFSSRAPGFVCQEVKILPNQSKENPDTITP